MAELTKEERAKIAHTITDTVRDIVINHDPMFSISDGDHLDDLQSGIRMALDKYFAALTAPPSTPEPRAEGEDAELANINAVLVAACNWAEIAFNGWHSIESRDNCVRNLKSATDKFRDMLEPKVLIHDSIDALLSHLRASAGQQEHKEYCAIYDGSPRCTCKTPSTLAADREGLAMKAVCAEILDIMRVYDEQSAKNGGYVDTPGGLEHMGDVWRLLDGWRDAILSPARGKE